MQNVALIGCAHIHTPDFVRRLKKRSDIKVAAVWDHDAARAQKNATELGGAPVVKDVKSIWSDPSIPAVIICSETIRHEDLALPAASAKKHLFIEKPLAMGSRDANVIRDAILKAGVIYQTGHFMRSDPKYQALRKLVKDGAFGKITRMRHSMCHSGAIGGWFDTDWRWMTDVKQSGVGAFGDLGAHAMDIMLLLMGEVESCTAAIGTAVGRYPDCDDFGEGLLKFKSGAVGTLAGSWVDAAHPVSLLLSGTEGHASIVHDQLFVQSKKMNLDGKTPYSDLPPAWPHAFELFLDAINGQRVDLVTVQESAYRCAVMEAMYEGSKQRKWIAPM